MRHIYSDLASERGSVVLIYPLLQNECVKSAAESRWARCILPELLKQFSITTHVCDQLRCDDESLEAPYS